MPLRRLGRRWHRGGGCRAAFTAVEMLIVIFIISLLMAFIVVAVQGIHHRAQDSATRSIMANLQAACDRYFRAWRHFPPDNIPGLCDATNPPEHAGLDADALTTVLGSECLAIALSSTRLGGPFHDMDANEMCDLDEDAADTFPLFLEFADGYGVSIRYQDRGDTEGVRLWSAGPDGRFGTDDDVRSW